MKRFAFILALAGALQAEVVTVPEGTPVRVRLDTHLNSSQCIRGQLVDFVVVDEVRIGDTVVIESGAKGVGSVLIAEGRKSMGRAGKLDFSVERVRGVDGRNIQVRPTKQLSSGQGSTVRTGLITAGVAALFWPAAPLVLLHKGKDAEVPRGAVYTVYTDVVHNVNTPSAPGAEPKPLTASIVKEDGENRGDGSIQVDADVTSAEVELDGKFVGNTPTKVPVKAGLHLLTVRDGTALWMREIEVRAGSTANVKARLAGNAAAKASTTAANVRN